MEIIDGDGYLLGIVNIIDALVVLLLIAVLTAGISLVLTPPQDPQTQVVTFRSTPQPSYVVDAVNEGPIPTSGIVSVDDKTVQEEGSDTYVLQLQITLETGTASDGLPSFRGERLYVGRELTLDLGRTIIDGVVIGIGSESA